MDISGATYDSKTCASATGNIICNQSNSSMHKYIIQYIINTFYILASRLFVRHILTVITRTLIGKNECSFQN